jgi:hypothetical protein
MLTVSPDATYLSEPWPKEFLDIVIDVATVYEQNLLDHTKMYFNDGSFKSLDPIPANEVEVIP